MLRSHVLVGKLPHRPLGDITVTDQERITLESQLADTLAVLALNQSRDARGNFRIDRARRIATRIASLPGSAHEQKIAALLSDPVNASANRLTLAVMVHLFGPTVGNLIDILDQRGRDYQTYIEDVSAFPLARAIKKAELDDDLDPSRGPLDADTRSRLERARQLLIDREGEQGDRNTSPRSNTRE